MDDKCTEKASALTYFSLLSIVPVLAMLFAVAKGFGIEGLMEREVIYVPEWSGEDVKQCASTCTKNA